MSGRVGAPGHSCRILPSLRGGLYKLALSLPPTPRVKVKQPRIPGMGSRPSGRKFSREQVVAAKLMAEVMPVSQVAVQLGIPATAIQGWIMLHSCRDWEPTPAERTKFYSERT